MKNWIFFVFISVAIGFVNEWAKLNVNFQLYCHDIFENWEQFSIEEKQKLISEMSSVKEAGYYNQPEEWAFLLVLGRNQLTYLKWFIPLFFSLLFFTIEYFMVPLLFNNLHIQRKHVIQYYAMVFAAVFLFFGLYYFLSWPPLLSISRKVWTLLQGPSLFILLLFYQKILKYVK